MAKREPSERAVELTNFMVQLDMEARRTLNKLVDDRAMTQTALLTRLITWFTRQEELLQAYVVKQLPDQVLARVADSKRKARRRG